MPLDQSAVNLTIPVCQWIRALSIWWCLYDIGSERCQSDDACMPMDQSAVNLMMPVWHWIRALSIWWCLYDIGSEHCQSNNDCMPLDQSAVNLMMPVWHWIRALSMLLDCCMLVFAALINALDQWALSMLWHGNASFLPCNKAKFKGQFKILVQ